MTTQQPDFWGDIGVDTTVTPSMILKQQAALLGAKTNHLLEAEVRTAASGESFFHSFYLLVPGFDNYTYELFRVYHRVSLYPVCVYGESVEPLETEEDFKQWVHQKLSSPDTKRIVANLLSLARG
jgi:hypothetical protein